MKMRGTNSVRNGIGPTALAAFTLFLGSANPVDAACREFVVVGEDASYLLLDGENWVLYRVGNYWSEGVRQVSGVLPGSSDRRAAFATSEFVSIYDREPMVATLLPADGGPNAVVVLRMAPYARRMGRPRSPAIYGDFLEFLWPPFYYALEGAESVQSYQWVHWLQEDTLFRTFEVGGANAVYHLAGDFASEEVPESGEMEVLNVWDIGDMDLTMPFCAVGETLYFTDTADSLSVPAAGGPNIERRPLAALTEGGYELTPLHTKNCKALASRPSEDESELIEYALYDIAADAVESEFAAPASARNLLFADGSRWLRQLAQNPEAQDSADEELVPSATFQLIDTVTGVVLRETVLDVPGGALIEEMQCDADTPRAVIAGPRRIWLLDPATLTVVAENEIPFDRDYFVFE